VTQLATLFEDYTGLNYNVRHCDVGSGVTQANSGEMDKNASSILNTAVVELKKKTLMTQLEY